MTVTVLLRLPDSRFTSSFPSRQIFAGKWDQKSEPDTALIKQPTAFSSSSQQRGFTLLEVMIALAILGMSLTVISHSYQNSVRAATRSRLMSVAVMLARYKMIEVEDTLFEKGFSDFAEEEKGDFKDEGFDRYTYVVKVDKVELPTNLNADSLSKTMGALTGSDTESSTSSSDNNPQDHLSTMMKLGTEMIAKQMEMIRGVLEQSIRRIQLKVEWKEGSRTREITVAAYITDPRKIDAALGGLSTTTSGTQSTSGSNTTTGGNLQLFQGGQ
jgi:general secretion pathway protein I